MGPGLDGFAGRIRLCEHTGMVATTNPNFVDWPRVFSDAKMMTSWSDQ
jgi:hypothetical protein